MGVKRNIRSLTVQEAGRLGGLAVLKNHGKGHFSEIGKLGQAEMRKKYPDKASEWGKLGGRPTKSILSDMGQEGT